MKKYFNTDTLFGIAVIALCILFFFMGSQLTGMKGQAGPGMFAQMIAVVTGFFALLLTINGIRDAKNGVVAETAGTAADRKLFYQTLILVALYIASWQYVHFIICTAVFMLAMCWVMKMSWKFAIIYSAVFSVGIYYVFANVFKILL